MPCTHLVPGDSMAILRLCFQDRDRLRTDDRQYTNTLKLCDTRFYKNKTGGCDKRVTGSTLNGWSSRNLLNR